MALGKLCSDTPDALDEPDEPDAMSSPTKPCGVLIGVGSVGLIWGFFRGFTPDAILDLDSNAF